MGLSSNQARFLSLTARQVDMEHRIQQVCQRRLRLASELEKVATEYNKSISNRRMFIPPTSGHERINLSNLEKLGYLVMETETNLMLGDKFLPVYQLDTNEVPETGTINAITSLDAGLKEVQYMDLKTGAMTTAIGIYSADALKALSSNQGVAGVISSNYILMEDVDLGGFNWTSLGNNANRFTGSFNANEHSISNLTINGTNNLGFFGTIGATGRVTNFHLNNVNITAGTGAREIGALAGLNYGTVENVDATNVNVNITGILGSSPDSAFNAGPNCVGGLVGGNSGNVDIVSVDGRIIINSTGALDGVGSLIGCNGSATAVMSNSYVNLDILTNSNNLQCVNTFVGCDNTPGTYTNCYSEGMIYRLDGVTVPPSTAYQNTFFSGHSSASIINNCYKVLSNGTYRYWNGTAQANNGGSSTFDSSGANWKDSINGLPIWNSSTTPPVLNLDTINTYWYDGEDPTQDELEEGLRNGTYYLAKPASEFTQNPIRFNGLEFEKYDWRSTPEVYDELYESDNVEAENKYDKTVEEINSQDKRLQLEQTSIEVQYKAISSERESVKKILDQNAQSSFKYFS